MVFNATFHNIFSYIVAITFIGAGNRSTREKPPICRKSVTNLINYHTTMTSPHTNMNYYRCKNRTSPIKGNTNAKLALHKV